jgi:hypothetical protein
MLTGPAAVEMCRGDWLKQIPPSLINRDDDLNAARLASCSEELPFPVKST